MVFRRKPNNRHRRTGSFRRTTSPRVTVAVWTLTRISFASGAGFGTSASSSRAADPDLVNKTALNVLAPRVPVSQRQHAPKCGSAPLPGATSPHPTLWTQLERGVAIGGEDEGVGGDASSPPDHPLDVVE